MLDETIHTLLRSLISDEIIWRKTSVPWIRYYYAEAVNDYEVLIQERRRLIGEIDAAKVHADSEARWACEYFKTAPASATLCAASRTSFGTIATRAPYPSRARLTPRLARRCRND